MIDEFEFYGMIKYAQVFENKIHGFHFFNYQGLFF
jgi:hypothetical protein